MLQLRNYNIQQWRVLISDFTPIGLLEAVIFMSAAAVYSRSTRKSSDVRVSVFGCGVCLFVVCLCMCVVCV